MKRHLTLLICMMFLCQWMHAEDGSLLWLRQKGTTATSITSNKTTSWVLFTGSDSHKICIKRYSLSKIFGVDIEILLVLYL